MSRGVTGKQAEEGLLHAVGITVNKNLIPFDTQPAQQRLQGAHRHPCGVRARLPVSPKWWRWRAWSIALLTGRAPFQLVLAAVRYAQARALCDRFPIYR